jgi:signal transduction histidine kinase
MVAVNGHRHASRSLQIAAVAAMVCTALSTWICYVLVARAAPAGAQPVVWLGLLSMVLEITVAAWYVHTVAALEESHRKDRMRFVATAIHDVRQPLQAAALFVDSLIHASLGPQPLKTAQCLDQSIQSVHHILDDLLDLSSLDAGAVRVKDQVFNLAALLHALETQFGPDAISKNLRLCLYYPAKDVWVNSDPKLVQMILRKLLIHAIAQTQQGGVLLGMRQRAGRVLIQVWDTRTSLQQIPDLGAARGLAIANRVAELIQSPLVFESKMGRGAVSTLTLLRDRTPHI